MTGMTKFCLAFPEAKGPAKQQGLAHPAKIRPKLRLLVVASQLHLRPCPPNARWNRQARIGPSGPLPELKISGVLKPSTFVFGGSKSSQVSDALSWHRLPTGKPQISCKLVMTGKPSLILCHVVQNLGKLCDTMKFKRKNTSLSTPHHEDCRG